ncbi:Kinesin-like protein [Seminavis robusta]|uniref:Kinesin-like protein n=1 Tax=Seminavis robusta TaxID=568900 RepID=A0A9N8EH20_9STRA|nr:Kinesin-like protein [Seminavis robusta]|eukprot:Sro1180_g249720.1 Kinesin-like protein (1711) ;mRNA; r:11120-16443
MAAPSASSSCQVRVGVRIRPLTNNEIKQGGKRVLDISPPCVGIGERRFTYDAVFDSFVGQQELYESVSKPLLASFVDGYNATIMAYGQTGSGKTFTMGSEAHSEFESAAHTGLIPRFLAEIFDQLQRQKDLSLSQDMQNNGNGSAAMDFKISASFLEVYGEDVHDLLDSNRPSLPLREDSNGGIVIAGLTNSPVVNAAEALEVLNEGTMNRTTAATLMNLTSSRSHAVFTIHLSKTTRSANAGDVDMTTESKFTFVDLAGSERMKKTGAEGERAREGIKINEGLLALGNVINALADEERLAKEKKVHVPYRQSKLTRLLQDALGGNSQTLFLACVSPSNTNAGETVSTLHYANRARNIKNAPTKNVDAHIVELHRLNNLTRVMQCELVKLRFKERQLGTDATTDADEKIGEIDDSLLNRSDVQDYILQLHEVANQAEASSSLLLLPAPPVTNQPGAFRVSPPSAMEFASPARTRFSNKRSPVIEATPNRSILEKFDDPLLDEVDPDAEMAILDQLLEVQHQDQKFGQQQEKDNEQLQQVEGELAVQEGLLLQLKESLRVYHNMKEKYEVLMAEVQQLEVEKEQLADQLEKAKADPSTGCSASIKKKLEKVEQTLSRARNETRKHRQMCRKAEQEAQKCKTLERKITELKHGRVALMKKQKEAAAKHKEYTDAKTREIMALKRKERKAEKHVSKLQNEVRLHKSNLNKRQNYIHQLNKKMKQTETHLMKVLSSRQRDFRQRASTIGAGRRRSTMLPPLPNADGKEDEPSFAPLDDEVKSAKFVLEKFVKDRVTRSELQQKYEERVAEYSEAMREMVKEVKILENTDDDAMEDDDVEDRKQNVEELELKVEVLGRELEDLRARLPNNDDPDDNNNDTTESVLAAKTAPVLRTLLMETVELYAKTELERRRVASAVARKDCALVSLENEVEALSNKITGLTNDISRRRRLSGEDQVQMLQNLEEEKSSLEDKLREAQDRLNEATSSKEQLQKDMEKLGGEHAAVKEKLTLADTIIQQTDGVHPSEGFFDKAQLLWQELGVDLGHREAIRQQIESCLEDTCARKLEEASDLKSKTSTTISRLEGELNTMQSALGLELGDSTSDPAEMTLLQRLEWLQGESAKLQPTVAGALERREKIARDAQEITSSMMISKSDLSSDLQSLIRHTAAMQASQEHEDPGMSGEKQNGPVQGNLSDRFLSGCEEELSSLRLKKARLLVRNTEVLNLSHKLVQEMNLSEDEVVAVSLHSVKQRLDNLPSWWDQSRLVEASTRVVQGNGVLSASRPFSDHLEMIHDSLSSVAKGRSQLSSVLREIVNRAQKTLLDTVERELDASEAYTSFHDALFRLPPLSQEFVEACITEMDALKTGVETMTQSEIEALTVVWEALNVSLLDRGKFWSEIDEATKAMESSTESPFDEVLRICTEDKEQWVLTAIKNCRSCYKRLETRLFKLERIHRQVERLRARQDTKSRIISLDSELRLLSARLSEFEVKRCSKQRLLTKKSGSAALLKEERFRKQMQGKYTATLEQLAAMLQRWKDNEGVGFDRNLLSTEVRTLLKKSDGVDNWVEKRTEFMHLRMVQSAVKRKPAERSSRLTPPRKRPVKPAVESSTKKKREVSRASPAPQRQRIVPLDPNSALKKRKPQDKARSTLASSKSTKTHRADSPGKPRPQTNRNGESSTLLPFGKVLSEHPENENKKKRQSTMLPFGNVLSDISEN